MLTLFPSVFCWILEVPCWEKHGSNAVDPFFRLSVPAKASFCSTPWQHEFSASPVGLLSLLVPKRPQKVNNYRAPSAKDGWRSAAD